MLYTANARGNTQHRIFAFSTIILGFIGWFTSFELATEYINKLKNPAYIPNCDINPLVTCGPNMGSWQGSLFGFSNTFIGIAAFIAPIIVGFALLAGAQFANWFWQIYTLCNFLGFAFILWLSWQSIFIIGTLCPWCMVVWLVMTPLFWVTLSYIPARIVNVPEKTRARAKQLLSWAWVLVVLTYVYIATIAQLNLNWLHLLFR